MTIKAPAPAERVLSLLKGGKTTAQAAELAGWPRPQVVALAGRQKGWLLDPETDRVTEFRRPPVPAAQFAFGGSSAPSAPSGRKAAGAAGTAMQLDVRDIDPHPTNVRRSLGDLAELADSIRAHGIIEPLVVAPHPHREGGWQLLAGHRRMAAAQLAGLDRVPVVVHDPVDAGTAVELMLIENCHRADLNPMDKAEAFAALLSRGYSQTLIAKRTGIAQSTVSHFLILTELDADTQQKVRDGELAVGDAIKAVRRFRASSRKKQGKGSPGGLRFEGDHFGATHPLAAKAARLCSGQGHAMRRRLGDTACGQCWEQAIRDDQTRQLERR